MIEPKPVASEFILTGRCLYSLYLSIDYNILMKVDQLTADSQEAGGGGEIQLNHTC